MLPEFRNNRNLENFYDMMDNFFKYDSNKDNFKLDIKEDDKSYKVISEMPGVKKENINIDYEDQNLTINVKKEDKINEENKNYIRKEIKSFNSKRTIRIPNIDSKNIKASLKDGILEIELPKDKTQLSKRIEIE